MFSRLSLKYRIAVIIFLLEAIMMAVVLQQTLSQSYEASNNSITNNQLAILDLVGVLSTTALITEEYSDLQPEIEQLIKDTGITQLLLFDSSNTLVASSTASDIGRKSSDFILQGDDTWKVKEIRNNVGLLGTLAIEFSNLELITAYDDARDLGITIAISGMSIIAVVGLAVGFVLTRRLKIITDTAERLAQWDLNARTNIESRDELGMLASAFDNMVQHLLDSKEELGQTLVKLQDREQNLDVTLNSIGDAVITTDSDGMVTRLNPVAEQLTGWASSDALGRPLGDIFPIIDATTREPIDNPISKVMATGEVVTLTNNATLISRDGSEYQIADSAAPIIDNDRILGMVMIFNDVTEQYRLRQELAENKRNLQAIMDNSTAVIYAKDQKCRYIFVNKQWQKLFGKQGEPIIGKSDDELFSKTEADQLPRVDRTILEGGDPIKTEETIRAADGTEHNFVTIKFPLYSESGDVYAMCGMSTDITEDKQQEERIRHALKMEALGKLTGGIAHDYNNMLGVITGYAEILSNSLAEQPKLEKYSQEIYRASRRGAKLTRKLLAFSRQSISEPENVDLNALLREMQLMLEKTLTVRVQLDYDLEQDLWPLWLDISDMEDTVLNICINAMHAITGTGRISIETRNEHISATEARRLDISSGDYVRLAIEDTGCGIDESILDKIFDPFFSTKGDEGTGLGLSQVYGFVKRSGGAIRVDSEAERGSRFELYFPRHMQHDSVIDVENNTGPAVLSGNETLLVVDDEVAMLDLMREILGTYGYHVLTAAGAADALELLEQHSVRLMLSDVLMPEMDGYQLAAIVKDRHPDVIVQLISGYAGNQSEENMDEALHQNMLHKPVEPELLLQRLRDLLDGHLQSSG